MGVPGRVTTVKCTEMEQGCPGKWKLLSVVNTRTGERLGKKGGQGSKIIQRLIQLVILDILLRAVRRH